MEKRKIEISETLVACLALSECATYFHLQEILGRGKKGKIHYIFKIYKLMQTYSQTFT